MNYRALDLRDRVVVRPLHARTAQFLEFYLGPAYRVLDRRSAETHFAPQITLVSPNTWRREDLHLCGPLRVFSIHFRPAALHHWLGVSAFELTDCVLDATDLLGTRVRELHAKLHECDTGAAMVQATEVWLRAALPPACGPSLAARLARAIQRSNGSADLAALSRCGGVSLRHMERLFRQEVGITPKHFARMTRFQHALHLRAKEPCLSWAEVADAAGYFDQAHLNRDVRAFADTTPSALHTMLAAAARPSASEAGSGMSEISKTRRQAALRLPACSVTSFHSCSQPAYPF